LTISDLALKIKKSDGLPGCEIQKSDTILRGLGLPALNTALKNVPYMFSLNISYQYFKIKTNKFTLTMVLFKTRQSLSLDCGPRSLVIYMLLNC